MGQNQHYVPQFYLRYFSSDRENINIFNFSRRGFFQGQIVTQCAKPNFYSESQEVEKSFSLLEGRVASILKKIITHESLLIDMREYVELLSFILWQSGRTRKASQEMLKRANDLFDYLKPDLARMEKAKALGLTLDDFNKLKVFHKTPALEASLTALTSAPLLFDLHMVLLINKSKAEFITSDSPTILFNSFFNGKTKGGQTGYANKGLQIFFPITPRHMLLLYDPGYYTIPLTKGSTYIIKKNKDIRRLNGLQILFGLDNVYFQNYNPDELKQQFNNLKHKRQEETIVESVGTRPEGDGYAELIHFAKDNATYDLNKLSFLTTNPEAEISPGIRNQDLLEEHRKQMKGMFPQDKSEQ